MRSEQRIITLVLLLLAFGAAVCAMAQAQHNPTILTGSELTRIVPTSFYFEGLSAPTQMRNAAAVQLEPNRHVMAGLVDASGYSSGIREKYQGFFITDSPITVGGQPLSTGAYGFGFSSDGKMNLFDIGGKQILSVPAPNDKEIKRPRPLFITTSLDGVRFYSQRSYVTLAVQQREIR